MGKDGFLISKLLVPPNKGYCYDNAKCNGCSGRGSTNKNVGRVGYPGRTGAIFGNPPK